MCTDLTIIFHKRLTYSRKCSFETFSLSYQQIIGDKAGRAAAWAMKRRNTVHDVHLLEKTAGAKVKFVHVVRNPFDNIATMVLQDRNIMARYEERELKVCSKGVLYTLYLQRDALLQ